MKTSEYRDLISTLSDTFASARSAATNEERAKEVARLERDARELADADCPKAGSKDREKAKRLLDLVTLWIGNLPTMGAI